ncbi:MAG: radical SAM protein [bacterium]
MNNFLLFPPQWSPLSPHFALTSIAAHLRQNNHKVEIRDLNIEFYNYVLTPEYLRTSLEKTFDMEQELKDTVSKEYSLDNLEYPPEFHINAKKFLKINELREKKFDEIIDVLKLLPFAVKVMKDKKDFYSLNLLSRAFIILDKALNMLSLPYYPAELSLHDYINPALKFCFQDMKNYCLNESQNMFYNFYNEIIPSIIEKKPDYIGISIGAYSQVIPGLTLAAILKCRTKAHINIGGNYFSRVINAFYKNPEFFEIFAHSIIVEEGEKPVIELLEYLKGQLDIKQVSSLIYLENNEVKVNPKNYPLKLNEMITQDLEGFCFEKYLMPEIVLPIQASRGCYWKKCTFCDHDFGQTYNIKDINKLVNEIKELNEKFGISYFEFIDEAINANYLKNFSEKILESGLKINWYCNARLETSLTKDILKLARQAGLRMILWGLESGSDRIMELINKGIDIDKRLEILRDAKEADIWNFAYIFFGFPTETKQDAFDTIDIICQNTDIISAYGRSRFSLGKHALIKNDPEKFGIIKLSEEEEEFSSNCSYKASLGLTNNELDEIIDYFTRKSIKSYNNPVWMYIRYRETLFLYICKYGIETVKRIKMPF